MTRLLYLSNILEIAQHAAFYLAVATGALLAITGSALIAIDLVAV